MKIKKIYISAFGLLKDFTLDIQDGFQVIYGKNEAGKTTITKFLRAMFYGTGKRAAGQILSMREQYMPFDGTPAAGKVFFESEKGNFCLERQFRKSDSTDKVTLINLDTGKSEACPPDIGNHILGISDAAFERSVFIGNIPALSKDTVAQGEINRKLSNIALTGEDDVSYQTVDRRLETAKNKLISKSGKAGSCAEDENERRRLCMQLETADAAAHKKQEIFKSIEDVSLKAKGLKAKFEEAKKLLESAKDIENAQKLKEYLELKAQLDVLNSELTLEDGTLADDMFLKKLHFGFSKLENIKAKIKELKEELGVLEKAEINKSNSSPEVLSKEIQRLTLKLSESKNKETDLLSEIKVLQAKKETAEADTRALSGDKKPFNTPLLTVGFLLCVLAAGIYFAIKSLLLSGVATGFGILIFLLSFILKPKNLKAAKSAQSQIEKINSDILSKNNLLIMLKSEQNNIAANIQNLSTALELGANSRERKAALSERIYAEEKLLTEERAKVLKFFLLPDDTDMDSLREKAEQLGAKAESQKQIKLRLSYLSRDLGGISYDEAKERLNSIKEDKTDVDTTRLSETYNEALEQLNNAEKVKTALETELKTAFRNIPDPEDLKRQIKSLDEKIDRKKAFCNAAEIAREVLSESFISARKSFGGTLENLTLENFKRLTKGTYGNITVSADLDILAEKNGVFGSYGLEYLSRGTKDQAYLSLRLAVAKLIAENEPLPVFLDDSLSQYDDERFCIAMDFLKDYGENTQVLLFSCHNFVCDEAKNKDIPIITL